MTPSADSQPLAAIHYLIDLGNAPEESWRVVAAHHLLTSRHLPLATMSIVGVDESIGRKLRAYARRLGLPGLRIPDPDPPEGSVAIELPVPIPAPSVTCEYIAITASTIWSTAPGHPT